VIGLPAALAFFYAFGFLAARLVWSAGPWRILALAFGLGLAEWLRGHLFTGFPWNSLGMALGQQLWPMQVAALIGLWGMTVLAVAIAAAPATIATAPRPAGRWVPAGAALVAMIAVTGYGAMRVPASPSPLVAGVQLRIMQPNLPQDEKFNPANREEIMERYLRLSDRATSPQTSGVADVTHLIWPESAFPFLLHNDRRALAQIAALLPSDVTLITGAARAEERLRSDGYDFFNSIHVVAGDGSIRATYDKVHLVPFGEYLPAIFDGSLRALGLREFIQLPGGFTAATRRRMLEAPGLPPIAAGICYEAIFPGAVRPVDESESRPAGMLLNVTNDAWFGDTPGPRQHFAQARLRAVEEGLPLVRAANSGISAVIDPYGRILSSLDVNIAGVIDSGLPERGTPTIFAEFGNGIFWLQLLLCLLASLTARRIAGT